MEIKTFRAKTMPQALDLVRRELGPDATVLHTREVNGGFLGRVLLGRQYEIAAAPIAGTRTAPAPSASPVPQNRSGQPTAAQSTAAQSTAAPIEPPPQSARDYRLRYRDHLQRSAAEQVSELQTLVAELRRQTESGRHAEMPAAMFDLFTDMIENDVDETVARDLLDRLRAEGAVDVRDPLASRARLAQLLEQELATTGPIQPTTGAARIVALVGPTGVGKTTTIAKLAANFRLRENKRVGLITVDTYRIAAVEQLRTYADIIDLPMEVVSTPREMREAVDQMRRFDLVLMDTAGRSPRDDVKIHELRSMLAEATPHEIHLVLSAAGGARSLANAARQFAPAGVTSLLVTKLDEATGPGNLLTLSRSCRLPFSYLTDGQNVPDDIRIAEPNVLSQLILGVGPRT